MLAVQSAPLTAPSALGASLCRRRRGRACRPAAAVTFRNMEVSVDTHKAALEYGVGCVDITPLVREAAAASGVKNGLVTVISKHTTTAVCVNENESRLFTDIQARAAWRAVRGAEELGCRQRGKCNGRSLGECPGPSRSCFSLRPRCPRRGTGTTILSCGASDNLAALAWLLTLRLRAASRRRTGRGTWRSGELKSPSTRTRTLRQCLWVRANRCRLWMASSKSVPGKACSCWSWTARGSVALASTSWASEGAAARQLRRSVRLRPCDDKKPSA